MSSRAMGDAVVSLRRTSAAPYPNESDKTAVVEPNLRHAASELLVGAAARSSVELTVLMPCLNEARHCPRASQGAASSGGPGLTAKWWWPTTASPTARRLAQRLGARVVDVPERGYGAALIGGIDAAAGPLRHHGRRGRQLRFQRRLSHSSRTARRRTTGDGQPIPGRHQAGGDAAACTVPG